MNIRYAKPIDKDQVVSVWNYCFEDGEDFVKYYFENVYDENNTIIIEENDEVLSALQLNKYTIDLRDNKYDVSYVVGVSSKPEVRGLGYMKHLMTYTLEELYKNGEIVSLLMAIDYRLYKRYGFDHCYDQIQYNLRTDELLGFRLSSKLRKATFEDAETLSRIYTKAMESLNGYAIRDYKKALKAVLWLVKNENMNLEDRKEVLKFFKKNWDKYKDTTPCLIFIPVSEVGINEDLSIQQYLSDDGSNELFNDIITGTVNPIKNCCCKKIVLPEKLSFVDLSPILPRLKKESNDIPKDNKLSVVEDFER